MPKGESYFELLVYFWLRLGNTGRLFAMEYGKLVVGSCWYVRMLVLGGRS